MTCNQWATEAYKHATECYPEECCGLVIDVEGKHTYWKCRNISKAYKEDSFVRFTKSSLKNMKII